MKTKIMFVETAKAFAMLPGISNAGKKVERDVQTVAQSAIFHCNAHRNADLGLQLVKAVKECKAVRSASLVVYLCTWGQFGLDDKGNIRFEEKQVLTDPEQLHAVLSSNHWTKAVTEPDPAAILDAGKQMRNLLNRIRKMVKEGKAEQVNFASDDPFATQLMQAVKGVIIDKEEFEVKIAPAQ
jgi:hypothetical protein